MSRQRRDHLHSLAVIFHRFGIMAGIGEHNAATIDNGYAGTQYLIRTVSPQLQVSRRIRNELRGEQPERLRHLLLHQEAFTFGSVAGEQKVGDAQRNGDQRYRSQQELTKDGTPEYQAIRV